MGAGVGAGWVIASSPVVRRNALDMTFMRRHALTLRKAGICKTRGFACISQGKPKRARSFPHWGNACAGIRPAWADRPFGPSSCMGQVVEKRPADPTAWPETSITGRLFHVDQPDARRFRRAARRIAGRCRQRRL
jgi:hypothetical protein